MCLSLEVCEVALKYSRFLISCQWHSWTDVGHSTLYMFFLICVSVLSWFTRANLNFDLVWVWCLFHCIGKHTVCRITQILLTLVVGTHSYATKPEEKRNMCRCRTWKRRMLGHSKKLPFDPGCFTDFGSTKWYYIKTMQGSTDRKPHRWAGLIAKLGGKEEFCIG